LKFKLLKLFVLIIVTLILLVAADQLLLRVPLDLPGVRQAQTFYVDFRQRLFGLFGVEMTSNETDKSIEQVIEATSKPSVDSPSKPQRYLYVDESGALQFTDSLQQVPAQFRDQAQPLAE